MYPPAASNTRSHSAASLAVCGATSASAHARRCCARPAHRASACSARVLPRTSRANTGTLNTAMAYMTLSIPGPNSATTPIASRIPGNANSTSISRMIRLSTSPPKNPLISPSVTPASPPSATDTNPTVSEMRPPHRMRLKYVAAERVGAAEMLPRWTRQYVLIVGGRRPVRRDPRRDHRGEDQQQENAAGHDRNALATEAPPELSRW